MATPELIVLLNGGGERLVESVTIHFADDTEVTIDNLAQKVEILRPGKYDEGKQTLTLPDFIKRLKGDD